MNDPTRTDGIDGVRDLLERAVADLGRPAVSTRAVYAEAARRRRRRRAVVTGAALLAVAGAVVVPGLVSARTGGTAPAGTAAVQVRGTDRAGLLARLLPPGAGTVEQADWSAPLRAGDPAHSAGRELGPLDGQYAVRREDGVGYLSLGLRSREDVALKSSAGGWADDRCASDALPAPRLDCVREQFPDGRVLTIWRVAPGPATVQPRWGTELAGSLTLTNGQVLLARDSTGFQGRGQLGPLLKSTPLTRTEFRALLLRPELLPGS